MIDRRTFLCSASAVAVASSAAGAIGTFARNDAAAAEPSLASLIRRYFAEVEAFNA